jgi:hypothetical protein
MPFVRHDHRLKDNLKIGVQITLVIWLLQLDKTCKIAIAFLIPKRVSVKCVINLDVRLYSAEEIFYVSEKFSASIFSVEK